MSEILKSLRVPQFGWYPAWVHIDDKTGVPTAAELINSELRQPDTIEVTFTSDKRRRKRR